MIRKHARRLALPLAVTTVLVAAGSVAYALDPLGDSARIKAGRDAAAKQHPYTDFEALKRDSAPQPAVHVGIATTISRVLDAPVPDVGDPGTVESLRPVALAEGQWFAGLAAMPPTPEARLALISNAAYLTDIRSQFSQHFDVEVAARWATWWLGLLVPGIDRSSFHGFDAIQFGAVEWLQIRVVGSEAVAAFNMPLSYHTVLEDGSTGWTTPVANQFQVALRQGIGGRWRVLAAHFYKN